MYCLNCGQDIGGKEGLCIHCSPTIANAAPSAETKIIQPIKPKRSKLPFVFIGGVLIAMICGGFLLIGLAVGSGWIRFTGFDRDTAQAAPQNSSNASQRQSQSLPDVVKSAKPKPKQTPIDEETPNQIDTNTSLNRVANVYQPEKEQSRKQLIDDAFHLTALQYRSYPFTITETSEIVGNFTAQGGGRNDAQCLIMDAAELPNFANGNRYKRYFDSESITNGRVDVNLNAGDYVIVFKNPAILAEKTVKARFYIK